MDSDNRFSGKTYRGSRRPTYRQVHREDTRRRWWPPPELPSSSNLVLVLRFRFQILFGTASGVTDQIQERSTVNPVKISSFGCRFSGLFGSCFGSSSFVTVFARVVIQSSFESWSTVRVIFQFGCWFGQLQSTPDQSQMLVWFEFRSTQPWFGSTTVNERPGQNNGFFNLY
ncbi:hypothetical protein HanPI659440_Chr04g0156571 [Helianthus annuus]|nr:hypothetical protein HanPI659440_Chr04g0156571 [Helianthus annuus]